MDSIPKKELERYLTLRIQTNATLLTEKIVKECVSRNIEIGISLDGREFENDATRKDYRNQGTFHRIIQSLELLKKYQPELKCLTVVTNFNVNHLDEILDFFEKIGIKEVGFLPVYEEPRTKTLTHKIIPNLNKLAQSHCKLFDKWIELLRNGREINITTFQILIWNLLSSNSLVKRFRLNCGAGVNSIFIESNGDVWPCGALSYYDRFKLGNILSHSLDDIQQGKTYNFIKERVTLKVEKCKDCPLQFICNGGCMANSLRVSDDLFHADVWCEYWKKIIKHILIRIYQDPTIIETIPATNIKKIY